MHDFCLYDRLDDHCRMPGLQRKSRRRCGRSWVRSSCDAHFAVRRLVFDIQDDSD